ncbi:hypothetical protein HYW73_00360 [Candidatus Nomurabacteria bacterium]|nr:hypothetical protein [Candidatus Nomurabacteria bacterium]
MQANENEENKFVWSAMEYEEKERSQDWFWALGIIIGTSSIASIIFENYFFAALLIIAGALLAFFAMKKPDVVIYELNSKGLVIHNRLYPYDSIKAFWVQADFTPGSPVKPIFFVHTERAFMPVLSIPINLDIAEDIHSIFSAQEIAEVEMKEHPSEKIMEALGF